METKEDIKIREILEKEEPLQKKKKKIEPQFGLGQVPTYGKSRSCLLYTSPSPRDGLLSRMPSSA